VTSQYHPTCSAPFPPFDVSGPLCAALISSAAVLAHLASNRWWQAALTIALAVGIAAALRKRWRRAVAEDPHRDLLPVLLLPTWGGSVVLLASAFAAALPGSPNVTGPVVSFVLLSVGSLLPSTWFASWLSAAAARGGPLPPGTRARALVGLGIWRTASATLWPVQFFGVFDTMGGRLTGVAAPLTAVCWLTVASVGVVQLRGKRQRTRVAPQIADVAPPVELEERDYRELQERPPSLPPDAEPEPDLSVVLAPELRADVCALVAISLPLVLHAFLIFT
jgi:hypothetical protein